MAPHNPLQLLRHSSLTTFLNLLIPVMHCRIGRRTPLALPKFRTKARHQPNKRACCTKVRTTNASRSIGHRSLATVGAKAFINLTAALHHLHTTSKIWPSPWSFLAMNRFRLALFSSLCDLLVLKACDLGQALTQTWNQYYKWLRIFFEHALYFTYLRFSHNLEIHAYKRQT